MNRRDLFRLAGGAGIVAALGAATGFRFAAELPILGAQETSDARLPEPFTLPLTVPSVLAPERTDETTDYYRITQRPASATILPGYSTPIWGYNGTFPGPTLVSQRGRRTVVTHRNELPVPAVVHLHGGHVPTVSDGYPTDLLVPVGAQQATQTMPGDVDPSARIVVGERDYDYPMSQPAATLWYHDHRMDYTGASVWRGLAGFHLIVDDAEKDLRLPSGSRDIPLMITDRAFTADGGFKYPALDPDMRTKPGVTAGYMQGVLGDVVLVNGVPWPVHRVDVARYRLRILNASNARVYRLRTDVSPGRKVPFIHIGSDGGLLERAQTLDTLDIAPGERFDVVVDFSECAVGDEVTIHNDLGSGGAAQVMRFVVAQGAEDRTVVPDVLTSIEKIDPAAAVRTRQFTFRRGTVGAAMGWVINDKPYAPGTIVADPRVGEVEIWRFVTALNHPVHLHLNQFQVLSRNGRPPRATDVGWKDTLDLRAAEVAEIAIRFTDYPGRYVMHCHNLEHEDMGMMATFEVRAAHDPAR